MTDLFKEFAIRCMKANIVPAENEIRAFLISVGQPDLEEYFIKTCFYKWNKITNQIRIESSQYI